MDSDIAFEYHCAKAFYRANEGKAFRLGYEDKLRFIALSKQVAKGPYDPDKMTDTASDTSYFNLVGNDRLTAWQKLGNMAKEDAMMGFVRDLRSFCSAFEPWYKAHLKMEQEKRKRENGSLLDSTLGTFGLSNGAFIEDSSSSSARASDDYTKYNLSSTNALEVESSNRGEGARGSYMGNATSALLGNGGAGTAASAGRQQEASKNGTVTGGGNSKQAALPMQSNSNNIMEQNSCASSSIPTPFSAAPSSNSNLSGGSGGGGSGNASADSLLHLHQIEQQKALIKNALNTQTFQQFKQYALSRYPQDESAQNKLIGELQEQHFQQYMQHIYYQQIAHLKAAAASAQNNSPSASGNMSAPPLPGSTPQSNEANIASNKLSFEKETKGSNHAAASPTNDESADKDKSNSDQKPSSAADPEKGLYSPSSDNLLVANPSMWTNKNMKEFKDLVKKDSNLVIRVGRGELVTIRVPTHEDGAFLFWEFATDHYDIGFGLHFEWTIAPTNEITITAEEPDEDEDDEVVDSGNPNDVEKMQHFDSDGDKPALDVIAPIFRRDSHMEVQAGSHEYPGQGCYLLKFDNTFSLFRGKTLYYRVYYTK